MSYVIDGFTVAVLLLANFRIWQLQNKQGEIYKLANKCFLMLYEPEMAKKMHAYEKEQVEKFMQDIQRKVDE